MGRYDTLQTEAAITPAQTARRKETGGFRATDGDVHEKVNTALLLSCVTESW